MDNGALASWSIDDEPYYRKRCESFPSYQGVFLGQNMQHNWSSWVSEAREIAYTLWKNQVATNVNIQANEIRLCSCQPPHCNIDNNAQDSFLRLELALYFGITNNPS